jgi:RNA polymerase sigma-70 factor, ECF subfamily
MDNTPDELIIREIKQGKVENFRVIVERYQKKLISIGMRFFRNVEEARDFSQEIFIKAYENLRTYGERAPFRYWLTRIAYNHGINNLKRIREESDISGMAIASQERTPEKEHIRSEIRGILLEAIDELPEEYRLCLDLFFFWGLTYSEIHQVTGLPVNTIKSHVLRAKSVLRDSLRGTVAEDYDEMR